MNKLPPAKTDNIVVQETGNELLIYDLVINKAYCLNETSKIVYEACNGRSTFEDLRREYKFTDDLIFLALDELKRENLIENNYISPNADLKRRELIRKIGLASVIALPVISTLIAPTAAMAAISCGGAIAPGTLFTCTRGIPGCEIDQAVRCASCSATAIPPPVAGCDPPFSFGCVCD